MPMDTTWSTAASTSSTSLTPHSAKIARLNAVPYPVDPRGFDVITA
jgi:hypothetical protein